MRDDFAVLIITHGRPDSQITLQTLKRGNYTGKIYLVIDDEDETKERYIELYGADMVKVFHKTEWFDIGDNLYDMKNVSCFARNECFRLAEELHLKYFLQIDDDNPAIIFRYGAGSSLLKKDITDYDTLFSAMIEFLDIGPITCLSFAVAGDFIGGVKSRKVMDKIYFNARNTFFCKTAKPFEFVGRFEDISTPAVNNYRGSLFMTIMDVMVFIKDSSDNAGGLAEARKRTSKYWEYFYGVMYVPSAIRLDGIGEKIQKRVNYNALVPKIINERYKHEG